MKYYALLECYQQVDGFRGALHRSYETTLSLMSEKDVGQLNNISPPIIN